MSNQIGMIFSFMFLMVFVVLSGEIIAYQTESVRAMSNLNVIATYVQNYGYEKEEFDNLVETTYFDSITVTKQNIDSNICFYHIEAIKNYSSFSGYFSSFNSDINCKISISRKEQDRG